ncbi:hypothetical protein RclHR1_27370003 [Rhizophagus clarus]|uniref:Uncharacterized protein n=1 Tax=Rhizophagus clarus TaxID=94130 RepID=A0A2Z6R1Y1_9GLOM|nr:hypothetical protein RclHR1_27370003 [Rhizophagus clarus]
MTQSDLSEFFDMPALYYCEFKASDIVASLYKICDDSVRSRQFLGADNADEIEAILSDHEGHSLHEFIDGNKLLCPIIDFNLLIEMYDSIKPKLTRKEVLDSLIFAFRKTCLEIFPKWNPKTITIASSSDVKKISYHISTYDMRLPNIAQVMVFTELVCKKLPEGLQEKSIINNITNKRSFSLKILGTPKFIEETGEHVHVKKAIHPKYGSIFDFMICPPNDKSEVVKSSLLNILKLKVQIFDNTNSETSQAELKLVEKLLKEASIEGFDLSFPSESSPNVFPLKRISQSYCSLYDWKHTNKNAYIIRYKKFYSFHCYHADQEKPPDKKFSHAKVYEAIQATVTYIQLDKPIWILKHKDLKNGLYFGMKPELKIANFKINVIEYRGESIKLKLLINQAIIKGFLAKPVPEINKDIMDLILWHLKNVICSGNEELNEYIWNWWAYLVQKPEKKP